jgi:hypothetical protein
LSAAPLFHPLDHRGLLFSDPVGLVARRELGKALAASQSAAAKKAYEDFLKNNKSNYTAVKNVAIASCLLDPEAKVRKQKVEKGARKVSMLLRSFRKKTPYAQ